MAYLENIVKYINDTLCKKVLSDKRFQNKKIAGIASPIYIPDEDNTKVIACIVDDNGEAEYIGIDDGFDLIVYHKSESLTISKSKKSGNYGDGNGYDVNLGRMSMVVYGSRKKLKLCADELALYIQSSFPDELDNKSLSDLQFNKTDVRITDVVLNTMQVFKEEYENIDYFLTPEQFLFKLNYSVESSFLKNCFTTCI